MSEIYSSKKVVAAIQDGASESAAYTEFYQNAIPKILQSIVEKINKSKNIEDLDAAYKYLVSSDAYNKHLGESLLEVDSQPDLTPIETTLNLLDDAAYSLSVAIVIREFHKLQEQYYSQVMDISSRIINLEAITLDDVYKMCDSGMEKIFGKRTSEQISEIIKALPKENQNHHDIMKKYHEYIAILTRDFLKQTIAKKLQILSGIK